MPRLLKHGCDLRTFRAMMLCRFLPVFFAVTLFLCVLSLFPDRTAAQNTLQRVSSTPRSDGKGFVVRLHSNQPADSFRVYQSSADLVQAAVYHANADTFGVLLPLNRPEIEQTSLHPIPGGVGISIRLKPGQSLLATSYVDANKRDILIPLTRMPEKDVSRVLKGLQPIDWSLLRRLSGPTPDSTTPGSAASRPVLPTPPAKAATKDDGYARLKNRQMLDVIVLDAGHGGKDPGALGRFAKEKEVTLGVALKLGALIKKSLPYVKIEYTRDTDRFIELGERGHIANRAEGDLFISIHCNSIENRKNSPKGASFYFLGMHRSDDAYRVMLRENSVVRLEGNASKTAELSEEQLLLYELTNSGYMESSQAFSILLDQKFTGQARRRSLGVRQAGFMVLYYSSMPAVLIELGFISNEQEEKYLASDDGQRELANAILGAVLRYKDQLESGKRYAN